MIGTITCNGSGVGRLGLHGFDFSDIPSGSVIDSVRITNLVLSNQAYRTEPNDLLIGFYANASIAPISPLASGSINLFNGPSVTDYASYAPVLSSVSLSTLQSTGFGLILQLEERGAILVYSLDLTVDFTGSSASIRDQYELDAIPDIPEELHEVLAQLMAIKACEPVATTEAAWARLNSLRQDTRELIERYTHQNAQVNSPIGSHSYRKRYIHFRNGSVDG